jgi:hypothetical protein
MQVAWDLGQFPSSQLPQNRSWDEMASTVLFERFEDLWVAFAKSAKSSVQHHLMDLVRHDGRTNCDLFGAI